MSVMIGGKPKKTSTPKIKEVSSKEEASNTIKGGEEKKKRRNVKKG